MNKYIPHINESEISNRTSLLLLILALLVGCILRCWNITQSFWWDELWSTMTYAKAHSTLHIFTDLGYYFNNHLLNSLLVRGSIRVFGESEWAARLPALIMGLFAIAALFRFGRLFAGASSAAIAAALLALAPFHIDHSGEARGYAGLALFSVLSSLYFLKGVQSDGIRSWMLYACCTVIGFCSHVFMAAVSVAQFVVALTLMVMARWFPGRSRVSPGAVRRAMVSLFCAGVLTVLMYSTMLSAFVENLGKVRLVQVDRLPFLKSLLGSFLFPGITGVAGSLVYGVLFFLGLFVTLRKDQVLCFYLAVLIVLPISLYLLLNPMFMFERYFIFVLPFALLVISQGAAALAGWFQPRFRNAVALVLIALMAYLQYPAIATALTRDRQDYREAVRYVEEQVRGRTGDLVFSLGYAGEHFRYYAREMTIFTPETGDELAALLQGKQRAWCLITAWLPDIRPPHEDEALYTERPGQVDIYNYVKTNFVLKKHFASKYGVDVYCKEY
jgi:4-amino-4-deoxy-L-arabinose transferase-like glycosyltransferase